MRSLFSFVPYVLRTAFRARTRSLLTVLGGTIAMMLFAFVRTVDDGVQQLSERTAQPVLVVFQDSRFCPLTSELPVRYERTIRKIPGVQDVLPTLVFINSCRSNLDLVTLHGVPHDQLEQLYDLEFIAGDIGDWLSKSDGALVGERLAERRDLQVGERVTLGEIDVHVSGIIRSDSAAIGNLAFVPLDILSLARERQGSATQFLVKIDPNANPQEVAAAIDEQFRTDEARTDTKGMQAFVAAAIAEIKEVVDFARWLGYLGVIIIALVVANTVFISAESRIGEMGVLETVGMPKTMLMALFAGEGVGLGMIGGILGTAIVTGLLTIWPVTLGVEGHGIDLTPSVRMVTQSLIAALVVGVVASLPPAIAVARRPLYLGVKAS